MTRDAGDDLVDIGRVAGVFGLGGEVKVATSDPSDFRPGLSVRAYARDLRSPGARDLVIASIRPHQDRLLVRFDGIADVTSAQALRGCDLAANVADLPQLPPGTYRDADLVGMRVSDTRLGELGVVKSVAHYPHADMLVVGDRGLLVPMLAVYGIAIDAESSLVRTSLPEGFEDL